MDMTTKQDTDPERIRACLERVLASRAFQASPKLGHFLRFVVEAKLAGQAAGSRPTPSVWRSSAARPDFDPDADSIVRVNASRLRGLLDDYYAGPGREDPVRFLLPKGSYVPEFAEARAPGPGSARGPARILLTVERLVLMGGPPEQDYLAAGLTEELVTQPQRLWRQPGRGALTRRPGTDLGLGAAPLARVSPISCAAACAGTPIRSASGSPWWRRRAAAVVWSETFAHALSSASLFEIQEQVARKTASRVLDPHGVVYRSLKRQPAALLGTCLALFHYHEYEERFSPETHLRAREALEAGGAGRTWLCRGLGGARQRLPGRGPVRLQPAAARTRPDRPSAWTRPTGRWRWTHAASWPITSWP